MLEQPFFRELGRVRECRHGEAADVMDGGVKLGDLEARKSVAVLFWVDASRVEDLVTK